jgi:hypothetical protein
VDLSSLLTQYVTENKQNCLRFGYHVRMMAKHVDMLRGVTLKCTAKPTERGSTKQYKKKCWKHVRPSADWSPSYYILIVKGDVRSVCLDFTGRPCRNQPFGTLLSSTTSDVYFLTFPIIVVRSRVRTSPKPSDYSGENIHSMPSFGGK